MSLLFSDTIFSTMYERDTFIKCISNYQLLRVIHYRKANQQMLGFTTSTLYTQKFVPYFSVVTVSSLDGTPFPRIVNAVILSLTTKRKCMTHVPFMRIMVTKMSLEQ